MTPRETRRAGNLPTYGSQRHLLPNVLLFGETGVGKSSVVNLIAGENIAKTSHSIHVCTTDAESYNIILEDDQGLDYYVRLFDTVGLNASPLGACHHLKAIEKANTLICQLQRTGGIRLLVFCIKAGRISVNTQNNYRLFCDILCQNQVPVAFVITHLEDWSPMEEWWKESVGAFEDYGLACASHACVTATRGYKNCFAREYIESQVTVRAMLLAHVIGYSKPWQPERTGWFVHPASRSLKWLSGVRSQNVMTEQELTRRLRGKCGFSQTDAGYLASKIMAMRQENEGDDASSILAIKSMQV